MCKITIGDEPDAVGGLFLLLTELNDRNPNAALTALLGSITGALGAALGIITNVIASNPSDRNASERE